MSTCRSLKVKIKLYHFIFINVNVCLLQRKNKMVYTTYVNILFDKRKIHLTWHWQEVYENHRRRNFANVKSYSGLLHATLTCTKKCHSQRTLKYLCEICPFGNEPVMKLNNFRYWNICKIYFYINYVPAHVTLNTLK